MGNRDLGCGGVVEQCENIVKIWGDRWSSSHEVGYMWLRCGKIKQKSKNAKRSHGMGGS